MNVRIMQVVLMAGCGFGAAIANEDAGQPPAGAVAGGLVGEILRQRQAEAENQQGVVTGALIGAAVGGDAVRIAQGQRANAEVEKELHDQLTKLAGTKWRLVGMTGKEPADGVVSSLDFQEEGRIAGRAGVNRYFGQLKVADGTLSAGPIGSTRMAGPPEAMQQEHAFLTALGQVHKIAIVEGKLVLTCGGCRCGCDGNCEGGCGTCGGECPCTDGCRPPVELVFESDETT